MLIFETLEFSGSKVDKIALSWLKRAKDECGLDIHDARLCSIYWELRSQHGDVLHKAANKAFDESSEEEQDAFLTLMCQVGYDIGVANRRGEDLVSGLVFYYEHRFEAQYLESYEFTELKSQFEALLNNHKVA